MLMYAHPALPGIKLTNSSSRPSELNMNEPDSLIKLNSTPTCDSSKRTSKLKYPDFLEKDKRMEKLPMPMAITTLLLLPLLWKKTLKSMDLAMDLLELSDKAGRLLMEPRACLLVGELVVMGLSGWRN
jgi:hypothetical protein